MSDFSRVESARLRDGCFGCFHMYVNLYYGHPTTTQTGLRKNGTHHTEVELRADTINARFFFPFIVIVLPEKADVWPSVIIWRTQTRVVFCCRYSVHCRWKESNYRHLTLAGIFVLMATSGVHSIISRVMLKECYGQSSKNNSNKTRTTTKNPIDVTCLWVEDRRLGMLWPCCCRILLVTIFSPRFVVTLWFFWHALRLWCTAASIHEYCIHREQKDCNNVV